MNPWLITDGKDDPITLYRTLSQGAPAWTPDPDLALQFARREDAELFAAEDEDAQRIIQHPATAAGREAIADALAWATNCARMLPQDERAKRSLRLMVTLVNETVAFLDNLREAMGMMAEPREGLAAKIIDRARQLVAGEYKHEIEAVNAAAPVTAPGFVAVNIDTMKRLLDAVIAQMQDETGDWNRDTDADAAWAAVQREVASVAEVHEAARAAAAAGVTVPRELLENIDQALQRHLDNHAPRQIPVHRADSDMLQVQVRKILASSADGGDRLQALFGSSTLPSEIALADSTTITLGDVVGAAFRRSGLTVPQWNSLRESARDDILNAEIRMKNAAIARGEGPR